jgi:hypothetical protein
MLEVAEDQASVLQLLLEVLHDELDGSTAKEGKER